MSVGTAVNTSVSSFLAFALLAISLAAAAQESLTLAAADYPITVSANGLVTSAKSQRFGPPPSRSWRVTITKIAAEGRQVNEGDVLVQFDASTTDDRVRTLAGELNAKQSELAAALENQSREIEEEKVALAEAKSNADKASRKADVDAALFASLEYRKLVAEKKAALDLYQREQARMALTERVRNAQQAELEADVKRLESELAGARRELESFTIRAPQPGIVIVGVDREGKKLDANDTVNPGMVVVELADRSSLIVQAEVPEFAAVSIQVDQPAVISIDAAGGGELTGTVSSVASIVRRQSQFSQAMVRDVMIALPADAVSRLRPGMSAKVSIQTNVRQDALAVPQQALRYRDGKPGIELKGGRWQPVTLGPASGGLRIVDSGLEPGMEIAL